MREVVLDTETTGLDPGSGHRIVEIGCIELANHVPTGKTFHEHLNPERDIPEQAVVIHGLTEEFLKDQPLFADIMDGFLEFIGSSTLIIHNAEFDLRFINAELERLERPPLKTYQVIDTVQLARQKFPGAPANLDALCRRFQIDNSDRTLHGALKDADLLAEVYLQLIGGRQRDLGLAQGNRQHDETGPGNRRPPRPHAPTAEEERAHAQFLEKLETPMWRA